MNPDWRPQPGAFGWVTPVEPSADLREAANHMRQMYVALVDQGFTAGEALQIIGYAIATSAGGGSNG